MRHDVRTKSQKEKKRGQRKEFKGDQDLVFIQHWAWNAKEPQGEGRWSPVGRPPPTHTHTHTSQWGGLLRRLQEQKAGGGWCCINNTINIKGVEVGGYWIHLISHLNFSLMFTDKRMERTGSERTMEDFSADGTLEIGRRFKDRPSRCTWRWEGRVSKVCVEAAQL